MPNPPHQPILLNHMQIKDFDVGDLVDKKNARRYDDCLSYTMVASKKVRAWVGPCELGLWAAGACLPSWVGTYAVASHARLEVFSPLPLAVVPLTGACTLACMFNRSGRCFPLQDTR